MLELGLKQWVVARQSGVARRTIIRWISGEVSRITFENLQKLAKVVNLSPAELSSEIQLDLAPTAEEQEKAASLILSARTGEMFLRSESYEEFEHLLNATRHPGMTMDQLANIYLHMIVAAAKQYEFTRALEYAHQCIACAKRCQNSIIEFKARTNIAIIHSELGRIDRMREELENQVAMMESQGIVRGSGTALSNLAIACSLQREYARATVMLSAAIRYYRSTNIHEAHLECLIIAARICQEFQASATALRFLELAGRMVGEHGQDVWEPVVSLHSLEINAALDVPPDLVQLYEVLERYGKTRYKPMDCFVCAVRALHWSDQAHEAVVILNRGLNQPRLRPQERAQLLLELAIIRSQAGNTELAAAAALEAAVIFASCGMAPREEQARRLAHTGELPRRLRSGKIVEVLEALLAEA